ncbi:nitrate- and nitrite sensing domain-containing protein [Actinomadura madurae]|uniref:nitrate- and nitrite sensing domain-containing protein n=1 Tax=Actinomadura madurae TaxID=1993 RepID=UPI0020D22B72|nr:nitrate- and nitrite sensing domain-containing protein [Actinomadura madurae]MCP9948903.1 nitrate- and nitrite sensing domain-containing protein [Actinomadura madurae]
MLILVPTVAAVVLSGLRISGSVSEAESYGRVERMAELGQGITGFVQEFTAERDRAVEYIAAGRPEALRPELEAQQRQTDSVVRQVQAAASRINGSYGTEAVRDAATVTSRISGLRALRSLVVGTKVPAFIVLEKYTESAQELVAVLDGISQNVADDTLAESSRALGALARAKEAVSRQRAVLLIGARVRQLTPQELNELSAARAQEDSELAAFRGSASLDQAQRFEDTVVGTKVDQGKDLRQRVLQAASTSGGLLPRSLGTARSANGIRAAMTDMIDKMRAVEKQLADAIKEQSDDNVSAARTDAMIDGAIVTALLLIVLLITIVMARSLVRPLRRAAVRRAGRGEHPAAGPGGPAARSRGRRGRHRGQADRDRLHRRDRPGRARLRRGPPRGGPARGRRGGPARQHQRDVRQPLPPQPVADRAPAPPDRGAGAERARRGAARKPLPAGPPRHPHASQLREPPRPRRPGAGAQVEPGGPADRRRPRLAVRG